MSILIKGMEMPEYCIDCYFYASNSRNDSCLLLKRTLGDNGDREGDCPLADVPTPHGRLIDADAINYEDEIWKKKCISPLMVYNAWLIAGEMPTIIEGEDGT